MNIFIISCLSNPFIQLESLQKDFVLKALVYCYMSGDSRRQSDEQIPHHIWAFHMILLMPKLYQFIRVNLLYQQGLTSRSKWKVFLLNWEKIPFLNGPKLLQSKSPEMTANTGLISTTKELVTSYLPISLNLLAICNKMKIGESYHSLILFFGSNRNSRNHSVCPSVCAGQVCLEQSIFIFLGQRVIIEH